MFNRKDPFMLHKEEFFLPSVPRDFMNDKHWVEFDRQFKNIRPEDRKTYYDWLDGLEKKDKNTKRTIPEWEELKAIYLRQKKDYMEKKEALKTKVGHVYRIEEKGEPDSDTPDEPDSDTPGFKKS